MSLVPQGTVHVLLVLLTINVLGFCRQLTMYYYLAMYYCYYLPMYLASVGSRRGGWRMSARQASGCCGRRRPHMSRSAGGSLHDGME